MVWSFDPAILLSVAVTALLYARGYRRMARQSRLPHPLWRAGCFGAGLTLVLVALLSPIGAYDQQLFALHMTEHMLLVLGAAPLLLLGSPLLPLLWGLPEQERRGACRLLAPRGWLYRIGSVLSHPLAAEPVFLITFGVWHVPVLYDAAQARTLTHDLEHILFFGTALFFWWPVIHPGGGRRRLGRVAATLYFVPAMFEGTLIGALLTLASRPWYRTYELAPRLLGMSPLDDQVLAGLIMWVPSGLVYATAIMCLLGGVLREEQRDDASVAHGNIQTASIPAAPL